MILSLIIHGYLIKHIVPAMGSVVLSVCNEKIMASVDVTFKESLASAH